MPTSTLTPEDLDGLKHKYEEIRRLRGHPRLPGAEVRAAMVALAGRFPGSLRELDRLHPAIVEARIEALVRVTAGGETEVWMRAHVVYHRAMRGAIDAKSWLRARGLRVVDDATRDAFRSDAAVDADARDWADALAEIAAPPRGRLLPLTIARVAGALGLSPEEVRALVLP